MRASERRGRRRQRRRKSAQSDGIAARAREPEILAAIPRAAAGARYIESSILFVLIMYFMPQQIKYIMFEHDIHITCGDRRIRRRSNEDLARKVVLLLGACLNFMQKYLS